MGWGREDIAQALQQRKSGFGGLNNLQLPAAPTRERLSPEEFQDALGRVRKSREGPSTFEGILGGVASTLTAPGAFVRSTLNETADLLRGKGFSPSDWKRQFDERIGFLDLLANQGMSAEDIDNSWFGLGGWGKRILGFTGDLITDPLVNWGVGSAFWRGATTEFTETAGRYAMTLDDSGRALMDRAITAANKQKSPAAALRVLQKEGGEQGAKIIDDLGLGFGNRVRVPGTGPVLRKLGNRLGVTSAARVKQTPKFLKEEARKVGLDDSKIDTIFRKLAGSKADQGVADDLFKEAFKADPVLAPFVQTGIQRAAKMPVELVPFASRVSMGKAGKVYASLAGLPGSAISKIGGTNMGTGLRKMLTSEPKFNAQQWLRKGIENEDPQAIITARFAMSGSQVSNARIGRWVNERTAGERAYRNEMEQVYGITDEELLGALTRAQSPTPAVAARLGVTEDVIRGAQEVWERRVQRPLRESFQEIDPDGNYTRQFLSSIEAAGGYSPRIIDPDLRDFLFTSKRLRLVQNNRLVKEGKDFVNPLRMFDEDEAADVVAGRMGRRPAPADSGFLKNRKLNPGTVLAIDAAEGQTIDNLWNAIGPLQKRLAVQRRIRAGMDEADAIKEVDELAYVEFEILRPVEDLTRGVSPTRANMNIVAHPEGLAIEDQMDDFLRAVGLIDDQTSLYVKNLTQREARYLASMAQEFRVTHFARYMEKMGVLFDGRTLDEQLAEYGKLLDAGEKLERALQSKLKTEGKASSRIYELTKRVNQSVIAGKESIQFMERMLVNIQKAKGEARGKLREVFAEITERQAVLERIADDITRTTDDLREVLGGFDSRLGRFVDEPGPAGERVINAVEEIFPLISQLDEYLEVIAYAQAARQQLIEIKTVLKQGLTAVGPEGMNVRVVQSARLHPAMADFPEAEFIDSADTVLDDLFVGPADPGLVNRYVIQFTEQGGMDEPLEILFTGTITPQAKTGAASLLEKSRMAIGAGEDYAARLAAARQLGFKEIPVVLRRGPLMGKGLPVRYTGAPKLDVPQFLSPSMVAQQFPIGKGAPLFRQGVDNAGVPVGASRAPLKDADGKFVSPLGGPRVATPKELAALNAQEAIASTSPGTPNRPLNPARNLFRGKDKVRDLREKGVLTESIYEIPLDQVDADVFLQFFDDMEGMLGAAIEPLVDPKDGLLPALINAMEEGMLKDSSVAAAKQMLRILKTGSSPSMPIPLTRHNSFKAGVMNRWAELVDEIEELSEVFKLVQLGGPKVGRALLQLGDYQKKALQTALRRAQNLQKNGPIEFAGPGAFAAWATGLNRGTRKGVIEAGEKISNWRNAQARFETETEIINGLLEDATMRGNNVAAIVGTATPEQKIYFNRPAYVTKSGRGVKEGRAVIGEEMGVTPRTIEGEGFSIRTSNRMEQTVQGIEREILNRQNEVLEKQLFIQSIKAERAAIEANLGINSTQADNLRLMIGKTFDELSEGVEGVNGMYQLGKFGGGELSLGSLNAKELTQLLDDNVMRWGPWLISDGGQGWADDVVEAMNATVGFTQDRVEGFVRDYDRLHNWVKANLIATPGFVMRNIMGGAFNNWFYGIPPTEILDAFLLNFKASNLGRGDTVAGARMLLSETKGKTTSIYGRTFSRNELENFNTLVEAGAGLGGQAASTIERGIIKQSRFSITSKVERGAEGMAGVGKTYTLDPRSADFVGYSVVREANTIAEEAMRLGTGLWAMRNGRQLDDAIGTIYKLHFDYSDLSDWEQKWGKRVFPFYTWSRNNLPLQVEFLARNPGKYNRLFDLKRNLEYGEEKEKEGLVPDWFLQPFGVQLPFKIGGDKVMSVPDWPFQDLFRLDPTVEGWKGMLSNLASGASPLMKAPIEYWAGKQIFGNIPFTGRFQNVPSAWEKIPFLMTSLGLVGLAKKNSKGEWKMTDRNLDLVGKSLPQLNMARRLLSDEQKFQKKRVQTWASFLAGQSLRVLTPEAKYSAQIHNEMNRAQEIKDKQDIEYRVR